MTRKVIEIKKGEGISVWKVRIEDIDSEGDRKNSRRMVFLSQLVDEPSFLSSQTLFSKLNYFHDGQRWVCVTETEGPSS